MMTSHCEFVYIFEFQNLREMAKDSEPTERGYIFYFVFQVNFYFSKYMYLGFFVNRICLKFVFSFSISSAFYNNTSPQCATEYYDCLAVSIYTLRSY